MKCQSCGRQSQGKYCTQCTDENGNLKTFEEITQNLTEYFIETQGFDREVARSAAIGVMSRQPAWEQKIKNEQTINTNKLKIVIAVTVFIVAITSGGLVYWFSSAGMVVSKVTYGNAMPKPISPFDDIVEKEVDGLQMFEIRCPGDQKIIELSNSMLMFSSLEGTKYSSKNNLYSMDLERMQGYPFEPASSEIREMFKQSDLRVFSTYKTNSNAGYWSYFWVYDPYEGESKLIEEDVIAYNNKYYIYKDKRLSIFALEIKTGKQTRLPYLRSFFNSAFVNENSFIYSTHDNYEIINLETGEKKKTIIPSGYSIIGGTKRFIVISAVKPSQKTKQGPLFVYNSSAEKLVKIDDVYSGTPVIAEQSNSSEIGMSIFYLKQDDKTKKLGTYSKSIFYQDEKPILISSPDEVVYPAYATDKCLVYTKRRNVAVGKWYNKPDDEKALTDLWVRDLGSSRDYQLEADGVDRIYVSSGYLAWTKWDGSSDNQFFNIRVAKLPPQIIDSIDYDSEGNAPYDKLTKTIIGNLEIVEMKCKGDQTFNLPNSLYPSVYQTNESFESIIDDDICYFNQTASDVIEIRQYDPNLPLQSLYLFDLKTESGVKVEMNNSNTKRFLDDHKMSVEWTDSSSIIMEPSCIYNYDYFERVFKTIDAKELSNLRSQSLKKYKSIRKEDRNGKTAIIYNDTSKDHEITVLDKNVEDVFISFPKKGESVVEVKTSDGEAGFDVSYYYIDILEAKATLLGTGLTMILDSNSRYILIKNFLKMSALQLFDKKTKEFLSIDPNLKPVIGDLSSCVINDAVVPEDLVFSWPYPEMIGNKLTYGIAYSKLSDISTNPKVAGIKNVDGDVSLVECLGDWILYTQANMGRSASGKVMLYGYNISTGETATLHDNFSSSITTLGDTIVSNSNRGFSGGQFNNICYIKIK